MSHDKDVLNRFLINTANHTMKVHRDDGIYRHLEFSRNGSNSYRFDLVTWPGYLCVTGDMGTWTFSRITDMFDFFTASHFGRQESFLINPGYWSEKFEAGAGRGRRESPCFEFDAQAFDRGLQQWLDAYLEECDDDDDAKEVRDAIDELKGNTSPQRAMRIMPSIAPIFQAMSVHSTSGMVLKVSRRTASTISGSVMRLCGELSVTAPPN